MIKYKQHLAPLCFYHFGFITAFDFVPVHSLNTEQAETQPVNLTTQWSLEDSLISSALLRVQCIDMPLFFFSLNFIDFLSTRIHNHKKNPTTKQTNTTKKETKQQHIMTPTRQQLDWDSQPSNNINNIHYKTGVAQRRDQCYVERPPYILCTLEICWDSICWETEECVESYEEFSTGFP